MKKMRLAIWLMWLLPLLGWGQINISAGNGGSVLIGGSGGGGGNCGSLSGDTTSTNCGNNNLQGNTATYVQTFGYTNGNVYPTVSKMLVGSYNMVPSYFFIANPFVGVGYDNFTGGTYTNFGTSLGMYAFGYGNFGNTGSWNLQNADATAVGDNNFNLNGSTITSFRTNYAFGTDNFSGGSTLPSSLSLSENMGLGDSNFCASQFGTTTITDSFLVGEFNDCYQGAGSMTQHNVFGLGDANLNFAMGTATDVYNDLIGIGDTSTQLGTQNLNDTSHDVIGIGNKTMDGDNVSEIVAAGHLAAEWVQSSNYIITSGYTTLRHVTNSHDVIAMGNMILNNGGFSNLPDTGLAYVQAEGYNVLPLQTITNLTDAICKGDNACPNVTGGSDIIAIGRGAGASDATGTQGVWIGQGAGPNAAGLTNTVAIGQGATNTMSNQTTIGNASVTSLKLFGCPAGQAAYDDGSGTCYTPGSGGGAVSSVFGRTGAVAAQSGDYSVSQVTGAAPLASPTFTGTVSLPSTTVIGGAPTNGQFWGYNGTSQGWYTPSGGGGMVYPGAGVANSTGTAWGTSYTVGTAANNLVQLNGTAQLPAVSGVNLTAVPSNAALYPTLNQNTTGTAANVTGVVTLAHGGTNAATNTAALSNLLGNPAIGTYAINCTSTSSCTYTSASGSGTVNSGTAGQITYYAGSGTAVSGDANLDDGATTANTLTYKGTGGITASAGPIKATGTTVGLVLSAGTAATGGAGKVVYATDATNGYAEVNENNTGLSRVCTAANGVCPAGTGTVTDGAGTTTAGQVLLSTTTAHAYSINATLPVASGGTGTATPSLVAGTGISITGTWPNQTVTSTGGGSTNAMLVPRDLNYEMSVVNNFSSRFDTLGLDNGNGVGTPTFNATNIDANGVAYASYSTGTTINTQQGFAPSPKPLIAGKSPSFKASLGLGAATGVNAWVAISSYSNVAVANSTDPSTAAITISGFRFISGTDTSWQCYEGDGVHAGQVVSSGVAPDTTNLQTFDLIISSGVYKYYINGTQVCSFTPTNPMPSTTGLAPIAVWENTTATSVSVKVGRVYGGSN